MMTPPRGPSCHQSKPTSQIAQASVADDQRGVDDERRTLLLEEQACRDQETQAGEHIIPAATERGEPGAGGTERKADQREYEGRENQH